MTHLCSERLVLRPWREEDKRPFAALNADPEVMEHFPDVLDRQASDALLARFQAEISTKGWGFWALQEQKGAFVGFVGLHGLEAESGLPFAPCVEIGWRMARVFWGRGYASEAARLCLDFAFTELRLQDVVAFTAVSNRRSQAVMHRLGMHVDSRFEHPAVPVGHSLREHLLFRIVKSA